MRLLVFGASGATGRLVVSQAIAAGHEVTAFVRRPERLDAVRAGATSSLRVLTGDVADARAVEDAVAGHDAVVSALGVSRPLHADPAVVAGVGHIVRAMHTRGVERLVYLSFLGVPDSRSALGPLLGFAARFPLRHEVADHVAKEALVQASPLAWTVVRPPKLSNAPATGRYRAGPTLVATSLVPQLSRADVASFLVEEAIGVRFARQVVRLLPA